MHDHPRDFDKMLNFASGLTCSLLAVGVMVVAVIMAWFARG